MKKYLIVAAAFMMLGLSPLKSFAASQDECAIWLCLPAGFPSGCSAAKSAFKDRIKHHKSPLPAFSSCAVKEAGDSVLSYKQGTAAWIPAKTCSYWYENLAGQCTPTAGHWQKDATCTYLGCQTKRYIDVKVDGAEVGTTYYY